MMPLMVLLFGAVASAFPAAEPDFSGTWVRDKAHSDPIGVTSAHPVNPGQVPDGDVVLTVQQQGNLLRVWTRSDGNLLLMSDLVYTLDGQDTTLTCGKVIVVTRAAWRGGSLVTEEVFKQGDFASTRTLEWSLSPDGQVLTIATINDQGARTRIQVYNRRR
jgi:hypothetical protein